MRREQFRTPEEEVNAEFDRVCRLFRSALGDPPDRVLFDALMSEASERGMNWVQGLEYVVEHRREKLSGDPPGQPRGATGARPEVGWGEDMQRAG